MQIDIAIITVRDDEFEAIFDRLEEYRFKPFKSSSKRTYAIFSVPTSRKETCVVALARSSRQVNDESQMVASDMMRDLDPQLLLVVGIAGGVPHNEFTLGDVIISSRIYDFDVSTTKPDNLTFNVLGGVHPLVSNIVASLPMSRDALIGWNENDNIGMARPLIDIAWVESHLYGDSGWREDVLKSFTTHFGTSVYTRPPLFKTGSVASTNRLLEKIPTEWQNARDILAIEMESAGVLQAAQRMSKQYPVMAIRGISDIVGLGRDARWIPYACQTAGAFTCAFIKAGIVKPQVSTSIPATISESAPVPNGVSASSGLAAPLNVFISYAVEDERFRKELETHLVMLRRTGEIRPWHNQQTGAGLEWEEEISGFIDRSQIIILLISPNFLASDYLYDEEMGRAMKRHASGDARVIPIVLRSADMSETPFSELMYLPRNHQPIAKWQNRDEAWYKITQELRSICHDLRNSQKNL